MGSDAAARSDRSITTAWDPVRRERPDRATALAGAALAWGGRSQHHLAALGWAFDLDDFGAGYGSFCYLKHLPFDDVKIDGEFIRGLVTSHADQAVVQSQVQIARQLGPAPRARHPATAVY